MGLSIGISLGMNGTDAEASTTSVHVTLITAPGIGTFSFQPGSLNRSVECRGHGQWTATFNGGYGGGYAKVTDGPGEALNGAGDGPFDYNIPSNAFDDATDTTFGPAISPLCRALSGISYITDPNGNAAIGEVKHHPGVPGTPGTSFPTGGSGCAGSIAGSSRSLDSDDGATVGSAAGDDPDGYSGAGGDAETSGATPHLTGYDYGGGGGGHYNSGSPGPPVLDGSEGNHGGAALIVIKQRY